MWRLKKKWVAVLCILTLLSVLMSGCGDATGDGSIDVKTQKEYALMIMDENGEVVSGANVFFDGQNGVTDGTGVVKFIPASKEKVSLSVNCLDYYDYTDENYQPSGNSIDIISVKSRFLKTHRLDRAVYNNDDTVTNVVVDLLSEHKKLNMSTPNLDFNISAQVLGDAETVAMYELHQICDDKDNLIATSESGFFKDLKVKDFQVGTSIYITVIDHEGHQTSTAINLEIGEAPNFDKKTELSFGDGISFAVANDLPIFGGTEFNLAFPSIPIDFTVSEDRVHIGFNVDENTFKDAKQRDDYKETISEIIQTKNTTKNLKSHVNKLRERQRNKGIMRMSGFDKGVDVCIGGYAEAGFDEYGNVSSGEGSLCVIITASAGFDWTVMVYFVPVTIGIEGSIEANFAGTVSYSFDDNEFKGDVALTITPSLTAKAGVGFKYLSAGVYGNASLETKLIFASTKEKTGFQYVDLTSSIGVYAKMAFFEPEKELLTGTFNLWTRGASDDKSIYSGPVKREASSNLFMANIYNMDNYNPISEADNLVMNTNSFGNRDVLVSGINPGASPVSVSDGKSALTVFSTQADLDDSQSTYSKLYYSYYEDGQWSQSKLLDEEKKNQMNPTLYSDGIDYYLMYQEANFDNSRLNGFSDKTASERRALMQQSFLSFDMHVKKFDCQKKEFVDMGCIETLGAYDYNAGMTFDNGVPYVYSASNNTGDYFGVEETTKNAISCSYYSEGKWITSVIKDNLDSVTYLEAGRVNGKQACMYSVDVDKDLTTTKDIETYCFDGTVRKLFNGSVWGIMYDKIPHKNAERFLVSKADGLYVLEDDFSLTCIVADKTNYLGRYAISDKAIYDVKKTGETSEIFAYYVMENGEFSDPVQVTFENQWQNDISVNSVDGRDVVVALSNNYSGTDIDSSLVAYYVDEKYNLSLDSMYISYKDIKILDEVPVEMTIKNSGNKTISGISISIEDSSQNELEIIDAPVDLILAPGESKDLTVHIKKGEEISYGDWRAEIDIINPINVEESDLEDNQCEYCTGYSDFIVDSSIKDTGSYPFIALEVTNTGNAPDSAKVVLLDANDPSREFETYSISNLQVGSSKVFKVNMREEWADESGKVSVLAKVIDAGKEIYVHNNYTYEYATLNYGTYNITYELNGGVNSENNPETYTTTSKFDFEPAQKEGYDFAGWYTEPDFDEATEVKGISVGNAGNVSLFAAWVEYGNINGDSSSTAEDALAVLKHVTGIKTLDGLQKKAADVNGDHSITAEDALDVLKKVTGIITKFKAEKK